MLQKLLMLGAGLFVAGIAFFAVYLRRYQDEHGGGPPVEILVAARDIEIGVPVQDAWIRTSTLPEQHIEGRHLLAHELLDVVGVPLVQAVRRGEPIMATDLAAYSSHQRALSGSIRGGRRALTVAYNIESVTAGLIRPGDHVDILVAPIGGVLGDDRGYVALVAENVAVLAIGQNFTQGVQSTGTESRERIPSATLQVEPAQAARITHALQLGELDFVLRGHDDTSTIGRFEVRDPDLLDPARRTRFLLGARRARSRAEVPIPEFQAEAPNDPSLPADLSGT